MRLGADLDAVRLIEVENKAINSFRNAIPDDVLVLMGAPKEKLNDEINAAMSAEANHKLRKRNATFSRGEAGPSGESNKPKNGDKNAKFSKSKNFQKKPDEKGNGFVPVCYNCNKKGHLAPDCRAEKRSPPNKTPEASVSHAKSSKSETKTNSKNSSGAETSKDGSIVSARTLKAKSMHR